MGGDIVDLMFKKKEKWQDGYYLNNDGTIQFYRDAPLSKETEGQPVYVKDSRGELHCILPAKMVSKVNQDKVVEYEGFCQVYRDNFLSTGMLRLHNPIDVHQEYLGTNFLFVPLKHRERLAKLLGHGYLIMLESVKLFEIIPEGRRVTWEEILGSGVVSELSIENSINIDDPKENRFFIRRFQVSEMFDYYDNVPEEMR